MQNNLVRCWDGFQLQVKLDKIVEEALEIVSAIENGDIENLHEEVADMEHLLDQIKAKYQLDQYKINDYKCIKNTRTLGLVESESEEE